jgi:NAD+--asparagine ADP-ribosyltransferase
MIQDIYNRNPADPVYQFLLSHADPIEGIISKIKMILGTRQGQILGDLNFGVGIEDLVFETRINKLELEERIKGQISQYITEAKDYKIEPAVNFGRAEGYDYCLVDIFVNSQRVVGILVK